MRGTSVFRLANGKIVEVWNEYDRNEIFRQLGVNPKVGQLYDMTHDALADLQRAFTFSDKTEAQSSR